MGKQVNFYMLEEDELGFMQLVRAKTAIDIVGSASTSETPTALDHLPTEHSPVVWRNKVYLVRPGSVLFTRYVMMTAGPMRGQGLYFIDESRSSVVEFSRCILRPDGVLTRGRIWAEMRRLDGDHFVYKGHGFEEWYDSIATWIRRRYRKVGDKPYFYIGPKACEWWQAGGQLQP